MKLPTLSFLRREPARIPLAAAIATAFLLSNTAAQTYTTSPPAYTTTEGDSMAFYFGRYPEARMMYFDGDHRGSAMKMKEICYRLDYQTYTNPKYSAAGRSWSQVTLQLSETDLDKRTTTFSANPTTTPTMVLDSFISWKAGVTPKTKPAPWSVAFPFKKAFNYTGKQDLCVDYQFHGGEMEGLPMWNYANLYFLDGYKDGNQVWTRSAVHGRSARYKGCHVPTTFGGGAAFAATDLRLRTAMYSEKDLRGTLGVDFYAMSVSPFTPVVHAISGHGSAKGWNLPGVTCNTLHVDLTKPTVFFGAISSEKRGCHSTHSKVSLPRVPYLASFAGLSLWHQAAFDDENGRMMLTTAASTIIPKMPTKSPRRTVLWSRDPTNATGSFISYMDNYWNPIARYTN